MATRQEQLVAVLERLAQNAGTDVSGAVVVSTDGIVLASKMASDINADRVGAVAATMMGVTKRVSGELKIGTTEETIIRADNGLFMVLPAGEQSLLAINLRQGANFGLIRIEARDSVAAIARIL